MNKQNKPKYNETLRNLKKAWSYAKKNKKYLVGFFIFYFILSIISAVLPIISARALISMTSSNFNELIIVASIVFSIEFLRTVSAFFSSLLSQRFFRRTLVDIQVSIAKETIRLESTVVDKESSGVFIDRLSKDAGEIADIFSWFNQFIGDLLSNIGVLVAVYIISYEMFLYFLMGLTILFIIKRRRTAMRYKLNFRYRELSEKNTGLITELVRGIKDIKLLNSGNTFIDRITDKFNMSNYERYKMYAQTAKYDLITNIIQSTLDIAFIAYGIFLVDSNLINVASFVVLYMYKRNVFQLINITTEILEAIKRFDLAATRVFEVIDGDHFKKEIFGSTNLAKINGDFEFKNVNFGYDKENSIIKNLSFRINANETVAFVGKSGGGKSTIFSLLTKLYNIDSGEIFIDNININDLDHDTIRGNISIITQNPYIFNFSIKENLNIVKPNLTENEMIDACKKACIHDFIMTLPKQYDTIVGEGGIMLSGGQRQRLAIARALIKNTEIILFDEATSSLDNETQSEIQKAINNMKNKHTILIIAHRLSTVINSDRIMIIEGGQLLAEGNHKDLIQNNKYYQKLYEADLLKDN